MAPGARSAINSSGFRNAAGQLGNDFAAQLASRRHELQSGALNQMNELSNSLLNQRPTEQMLIQKQQPFWQQILLHANAQANQMAGTAAKVAA